MILELAALSLEADKVDDAYEKARAGLELALQLHDYGGRVLGVGLLACVAGVRGDTGPPGCGVIEDDHVRAPLGGWPRHRAGCEARLVASCGGAVLDAAVTAGRHLSLDEAVALALDKPSPSMPPPRDSFSWGPAFRNDDRRAPSRTVQPSPAYRRTQGRSAVGRSPVRGTRTCLRARARECHMSAGGCEGTTPGDVSGSPVSQSRRSGSSPMFSIRWGSSGGTRTTSPEWTIRI